MHWVIKVGQYYEDACYGLTQKQRDAYRFATKEAALAYVTTFSSPNARVVRIRGKSRNAADEADSSGSKSLG